MNKTSTLLMLMAITTIGLAQSPRMSLYEEFTGENCPPCASTNPGLDVKLAANSNNTIPLKWQVAIPSAPSSPTSLYQQNKIEIDARDNYYSISSAPNGRMDGQSQSVFGAQSDHPGYITSTILNAAAAVTSPFTIAITREWDATFSTITCTVNITATGNYTTTGTNLKFRLVMTEKNVTYATPPGSNGEKDFHYVARKSYPDLTNGTAMANTWTIGQTQTFTIACVLPSYIWDKAQVEMVGFIQNDANKKVLQAGIATAAPLSNDARALSLTTTPVTCSSSLTPQAVVTNAGDNAITSMTLTPYVDGVINGTPTVFTGSLSAGASTTIALNPLTSLTGGSHSFSVNISGVSGTDYNTGNNVVKSSFAIVSTYSPAPITQNFQASTWPPTNWFVVNPDGGTYTWSRVTNAGSGAAMYPFFASPPGDNDALFLPPMNLNGIPNPGLRFDVAYTGYTSSSPENDQLEVFTSTDCGANWTNVYSKAGSTLATAPTTTVSFVPTAAQWRREIIELPALLNKTEVLIKFVGTSAYGNNLYIDNVNITDNVGIFEADKNVTSVEMFPNPTSNETSININVIEPSEIAITVLNTVGQIVYQSTTHTNSGLNAIQLDTKHYAAGIYNVIIGSKNGSVTKKLSVTK